MDNFSETQNASKALEKKYAAAKVEIYEKYNPLIFDLQIDCFGVILPAHK